MIGAALVAALALASQLQTHPTGLPSVGPSRANSLRTAPIMDKLYEQAGKPALDFDFARFKDLHDNASGKTSLVNFSRSAAQSPGTYVGADGLIHTAAVNLALYSEQFDNAAWVKTSATISANQIAAPDGKQTAELLFPSSSGSASYLAQNFTGTNVFTISTYVKSAGKNVVWAYIRSTASYGVIYFDLSDQSMQIVSGSTSTPTGIIEDAGNGWYRISVTLGSPASISGGGSGFGVSDSKGSLNVTASGTDGIYLWGAQLEETDPATMAPTAYIHTTSQALAAPRFDHVPTTGDLTTNLLTYSEMFDQWTSSNTSVTANDAAAPDGQQTADKMSNTATSAAQRNQLNITVSSGSNTFSVYAKAGSVDFISMRTSSFDADIYSSFNVASGSVFSQGAGHIATITDAGDGWYRCAVTFSTSSDLVGNLHVYLNADGGSVFDPDLGSSGTSFVYLWGGQTQTGSTPGPYVRTLSETRSISDANAESLGLLVEEARANLLTHSVYTSGFYGLFGITDSSIVSPSGDNLAVSLTEDISTALHRVRTPNFSVGSGTVATVSVFIKNISGTRNVYVNAGATLNAGINFDPLTGALNSSTAGASSISIEDYGNGWWRVSFSGTGTGATNGLYIQSNINTLSADQSFLGDGSSAFGFYGAQIELGTFPTSYIPTTGTSQYRYADVAAVQDEDFSTTNLLAYSESFDVGWSNFRFVATPNATIAPDGLTTADALTQQTGQTLAAISRQTISYGQATLSVFAKPNGKNWLIVSSGSQSANFNIATGEIGTGSISTAFIESAGNGWYRVGATFPSGTYAWFEHRDNPLTNVVTDSGGVYLWGASLTATEYPVAYTTTRNLLTDSQDFERSSWSKLALSSWNDGQQDPFGTNEGFQLVENSALGNHGLQFSITYQTAAYALSFYAKKGARQYLEASLSAIDGASFAVFNLDDGSTVSTGAGTTASSQEIGNGWYRYTVSKSLSSASTTSRLRIGANASTFFYTGDGAGDVLLYGVQLEPGTTATDYVRTVDAVGKDYQWYEPTEGTVFADFVPNSSYPQAGKSFLVTTITDGSYSNVLRWAAGTGISTMYLDTVSGGSTTRITLGGFTAGSPNQLSGAYKHADNGASLNGSATLTASPSSIAGGLDRMTLGRDHLTNTQANLHIRRLTYWPRRQADSTLQVITQ